MRNGSDKSGEMENYKNRYTFDGKKNAPLHVYYYVYLIAVRHGMKRQ